MESRFPKNGEVFRGVQLSKRLGRRPLVNPVLISIIALSVMMITAEVPYERYFAGAQFIHFLLGPATVAIAVPLYRKRNEVRALLLPISVALLVGSIVAMASVIVLGQVSDLLRDIMLSFLPKSATAGVAMAVSQSLGGDPFLTAVLVIMTGIFGALIVTPFMDVMQIKGRTGKVSVRLAWLGPVSPLGRPACFMAGFSRHFRRRQTKDPLSIGKSYFIATS
ncbi:LrgB family protein [Agrobacterium tomkonis]|uniref:LrgB family protein n=1 Tax=Agrobacterium tomkonis TaxID=1183410 RepID=UPI001CD846B5